MMFVGYPTLSIVDRIFVGPKAVTFSASQTAQVIWTPASGRRFVVCYMDIDFTSASGQIVVFDGTDSLAYRVCQRNSGAAGSGSINPPPKPYRSAAVDNVLKYTTGASAAGSLVCWGYEE